MVSLTVLPASPLRAETGAASRHPDTAGSNTAAETDRLTRTVRQLAQREADTTTTAAAAASDITRADTGATPARGPALPDPPSMPEVDRAPEPPDESTPHGEARAGMRAAPAIDPNEFKPLGPSDEAQGFGDERRTFSYGDDGWMLRTLAALGIVIGLIFLMRWGWMRLGGGQHITSTPVVEVLSRTAVAPRNHVLLLRVGQRILIVGDSGGGMRTLASVEDEQEVADLLAAINASKADSISRNFQQLLSRFGAAHDRTAAEAEDVNGFGWVDAEDGRDHAEHVYDRARDNVSGLATRIRNLSRKGGGP